MNKLSPTQVNDSSEQTKEEIIDKIIEEASILCGGINKPLVKQALLFLCEPKVNYDDLRKKLN